MQESCKILEDLKRILQELQDLTRILGTVHFLRERGGWWDLGGGGGMRKKTAFEGGPSQKNYGKRGGHVKYFSNTLKWYNVLKFKKLLSSKRSRKDTNFHSALK